MEPIGWLESAWNEPEEAIQRFPLSISGHVPHRRLILALNQAHQGRGIVTACDLSVLLRAVIRHENRGRDAYELHLDVPSEVASRLTPDSLQKASMQSVGGNGSSRRLRAYPWKPHWLLSCPGAALPEESVYRDKPSAPRTTIDDLPDPYLNRLGFVFFKSSVQREAARTILCAPANTTILVNMPTGSGKSICGLLAAFLPFREDPSILGVTPIIVPTVSLAQDLEARYSHLVGHQLAYRPEERDSAEDIRVRCARGIQGPIFLSPESLDGSLLTPLKEAARAGLLNAFVVDEAHMVTSWGDEFRPAFQKISVLRRALREESRGATFRTVLMSATITPYTLDTLNGLFGPIHHIHAVRLRPEPDYYVSMAPDEAVRIALVEEALWHLPRPLVLYVTRQEQAVSWLIRLRNQGFGRIGMIHGSVPNARRNEVLEAWNRDEIDIMIGTSAFGLGVDKPDIRAIVHATVPETIDRYYQDVGRGGRNGFSFLSLMVWTETDREKARRLGRPIFIGPDRGHERWVSMINAARSLSIDRYEVPLAVTPSKRPGDIDMSNDENERWNLRTLLLMARCGIIDLELTHGGDAFEADPLTGRGIVVRLRSFNHIDKDIWERQIADRRRTFLAENQRNWELMEQVLANPGRCLSFLFEEAYASRDPDIPVVRACGGCTHCRDGTPTGIVSEMLARHSPHEAFPPNPIGGSATRFLDGGRLGFLFFSHSEAEDQGYQSVLEALEWFCVQGFLNVVAPKAVLSHLRNRLCARMIDRVFFHDRIPVGIARNQPTAALLYGETSPLLSRYWDNRDSLEFPLVILVSGEERQPGHPTRKLREVVANYPNLTHNQWRDYYLE